MNKYDHKLPFFVAVFNHIARKIIRDYEKTLFKINKHSMYNFLTYEIAYVFSTKISQFFKNVNDLNIIPNYEINLHIFYHQIIYTDTNYFKVYSKKRNEPMR